MKRYAPVAYVLLCLLIIPARSFADCDCTTFPFKPQPPCQDQCYARLLNESSTSTLQASLGLSDELVHNLRRMRADSGSEMSWESYRQKLKASEFSELQQKLSTLDSSKVATLRYENYRENSSQNASMDDENGEEGT